MTNLNTELKAKNESLFYIFRPYYTQMTDAYYILEDGVQTGPFTFAELSEKELDIHTRVLSPMAGTWQDACDLPELYTYFEARGICFPTEDNLATFWWRLLAYIIDSILLIVVFEYLIRGMSYYGRNFNINSYKDIGELQLIYSAMLVVYNTLFEASAIKGSLGKKLCKLVVVDADGVGPGYLNALVRNVFKVFSIALFYVGFFSIFFSEHRQALHDYIAKTYVVKLD